MSGQRLNPAGEDPQEGRGPRPWNCVLWEYTWANYVLTYALRHTVDSWSSNIGWLTSILGTASKICVTSILVIWLNKQFSKRLRQEAIWANLFSLERLPLAAHHCNIYLVSVSFLLFSIECHLLPQTHSHHCGQQQSWNHAHHLKQATNLLQTSMIMPWHSIQNQSIAKFIWYHKLFTPKRRKISIYFQIAQYQI